MSCEGWACIVHLILGSLCPSEPKGKNQTGYTNTTSIFFGLPGKKTYMHTPPIQYMKKNEYIKMRACIKVHWSHQLPHELHHC